MATSLTTPRLTTNVYKRLQVPVPLSLHSLSLPRALTFTSHIRRAFSHNPYYSQRRQFCVRADSDNGAEPARTYDFDLFTIGAGSGGVRASRFAASFGASVAVCELPFSTISSETTGGVGGT